MCVYCGINISSRSERHLDHIVPLSKSGSHTIGNVQWTCVACNLLKSNKLEEEFILLRGAPVIMPSRPNSIN